LPRIPEFETRRAASSLVGTPGEDTSGERIGKSIASTFGQISDTFGRLAVERREAKDAALANKSLIEFELDLDKQLRNHRIENSEFRGDPLDRTKAFQTSAEEMYRSKAESIGSSGARQLFEKHGLGTVRKFVGNELDFSDKNQAVLALNDSTTAANHLAQKAAEIGRADTIDIGRKRQSLEQILKQGETTYLAAAGLLSPEQRAKLKSGIPEMIAKGYLVSALSENPEDAQALLDDGSFDEFLSPQEKEQFARDARAAIPKVKERKEINTILRGIEENNDLWQGYLEGDPLVLQRIEEQNTPFTAALRDLVIEGDPDPITQVRDVMSLEAKFDSFFIKKDGKRQGFDKRLQLKELESFMVDVLEARKRGTISEAVADGYMKKIVQPTFDLIKTEHEKGQGPVVSGLGAISLYQYGKRAIESWFFRNNRLDDIDAKAEVLTQYLRQYDGNQIKTPSDANALARSVLNDNSVRETPGLGLIEGTPNRVLNQDRSSTFVQGGKSDVKGAVTIPQKGTVSIIVPQKSTNKKFRITYKDGRKIKAEEVIGG